MNNKNKTTATMTWIRNNNYGSILQAYALQNFLMKNGYENTIIDYNPNNISRIINLFKSKNSLKLFYNKYKAYVSKKQSKNSGHDISLKNNKFKRFINENLKTSTQYKTVKSLKTIKGKYDVYICGSDQIWNPNLLNPPYFFDFLNDNDKKVAYAPSFGVEAIENRKSKIIKKYIKRFSHISVREKQGQEILKNMGQDISRMPVVLDPTLLLEKKEWENLIKEDNKSKDKYIVCYFLRENDNYWKTAKIISETLNLKIVIIPNSEDSYRQNEEILDNVGPNEWIKLIRDSEFVLTDSFHGIIFSIIFQKNFYAYKRFSDNSSKSQNSRVKNILKMLKLEERLFDNDKVITDIKPIENYDEVQKIIEVEREKSIKYLINAIER